MDFNYTVRFQEHREFLQLLKQRHRYHASPHSSSEVIYFFLVRSAFCYIWPPRLQRLPTSSEIWAVIGSGDATDAALAQWEGGHGFRPQPCSCNLHDAAGDDSNAVVGGRRRLCLERQQEFSRAFFFVVFVFFHSSRNKYKERMNELILQPQRNTQPLLA